MKVHFLGIGGSGASAAAAIAKAQGYEVTGCDLAPHNEFTENFDNKILFTDHDPKHLEGVDILAVTPAIFSLDPDNPELLEAKRLGIPILTWQQFVGEYLTKDEQSSRASRTKIVIAVAGTHGKTTTTAMIAQMLEDAKLDPTVLLGAIHPKWRANYRTGKSKYFVVEADEFNDNFLHFKPDITVVTNIEMDHPEYFKDLNAYLDSFEKFLLQTKRTIVANLKDPGVKQTLNVHPKGVNTIIDYSKHLIGFSLQIPGEFNRWNASAAYQVGLLLGVKPLNIKQSLQDYSGVGRRFELLGTYHGAKIYSDFGHHPTEIKVTMEAAREKFPTQRIILIYEPHMFSRTKALFDDFVKVFKEIPVDKIIITDIYPSREVDTGLVTSKQLANAVSYDRLVYHSKDQILKSLKDHIKSGDVIFFMGAGDIDKFARKLIAS